MLLRLTGDQFIDLQSLSYLNGLKSFEIISALIRNKEDRICAIHDSRHEATNIASQKLKMIQRTDRFIFDERGTNDLHIGWPFVRGKFSDGTPVRCPLLYFPVTLKQQGKFWVLSLRPEAGISFNKSFLLAYAWYHKVRVDEELLDFSFEDFDRNDTTMFRTQLYQLLQNRIELNFNRDNFLDELQPFSIFTRGEFNEQHNAGEIKLFPEAVLGIFPQTGSQLVPDYLHLADESVNDLESLFHKSAAETSETVSPVHKQPDVLRTVREETLFTPFPLDAYQENAIARIKTGESLVVQGPPGTGKSQLICNLLADAMAAGKKVLLVCQKRAALDVVYERMNSKRLSPFLALVHDFRDDRRKIFNQIAHQIENVEEYRTKNRGIDVIQAERRFVQICRSIDHISEELEEFRKALFNDEECGLSVKQLYLTSDPGAAGVNIKQEYQSFTFPLDEFHRKLRLFSGYADRYERPDHPWYGRKSFSRFSPSDEQRIRDVIEEVVSFQNEVSASLFRLVGITLDLEEAGNLYERTAEMREMLQLLSDEEVYGYFKHMTAFTENETSLLWLSNMERVVMNCFDETGPEVTVPSERLGSFQEALHNRMKARANVFSKIRWELFSEQKFVLKRVLVANDLAYNKYGLRVLEQRIDSRLNLEHHLTAIRSRQWLRGLPASYERGDLEEWFARQKTAIRAKALFFSLREIRKTLSPSVLTRAEFSGIFEQMISILERIPAKKQNWLLMISPFHLRKLVLDPDSLDPMKASLGRDFDNLCDFDRLKLQLSSAEEQVIKKLREHTGSWEVDVLWKVFDNSLRLAWIDHLEVKYPVLRTVSSMKMEEMQKELQALIHEKQGLSLEILQVKAREHVYEGLEYNRLKNRVTYRDLHHQVTKKKKLWPLRQLLSVYHHELFQLVPCWMASPESVSALFPMKPFFDLVIFDEASQCFAERGVPAIYRGKQVLVAGDQQQLRPSELYQIRWTDEDSDEPDAEVESLLELAGRYLPAVHLQGHYRSKSVELIEFSNRNFYDGRLRLLPDAKLFNRNEPAIRYVKVDGIWENQQNEVEAGMVVSLVSELIAANPLIEIGVVTFNAPQQNLILDYLEEYYEAKATGLPRGLFVKNIENVQGDEKDIIIFSTGYAPDKKGKMSMQFGSLGVSGGGNRLNVAVTRAREKVIVVSSIWPEQLRTADVKNEGPRLLQEYLLFARDVHERRFRPRVGDKGTKSAHALSSGLSSWGRTRLARFDFDEGLLPYGDVHVRKENQYVGTVLTDDERFRSGLSTKEIYAYTPALLQQKNWKFRFVYSRQWWKDPSQVEQSLMYFIGGVRVEPPSEGVNNVG